MVRVQRQCGNGPGGPVGGRLEALQSLLAGGSSLSEQDHLQKFLFRPRTSLKDGTELRLSRNFRDRLLAQMHLQ
jgi:hypothetical protein